MTLGEIIKEYRKEHGNMSQRQFAVSCNLSNGCISMLEKGTNSNTGQPITPTLPVLKKVADGMGLSLSQLFIMSDDIPVALIDEVEEFASTEPFSKEQPVANSASEPTYSPQVIAVAERYGVSPDFFVKAVEEDSPCTLFVADGTSENPTKMHYVYVTDREYELIYAYRFVGEKQIEIDRILDEPAPEQKKKPKP